MKVEKVVAQARDGKSVTLRRATIDDMMLIFKWQQQPLTRQFARNPHPPTIEEHRSWFNTRVDSEHCMMMVIMHGAEPGGHLRLDRAEHVGRTKWEVSLLVAPEKHRQGLGRRALELAKTLLPDAELVAEVLSGNTASQRLFESTGFQLGSDGWYHFNRSHHFHTPR